MDLFVPGVKKKMDRSGPADAQHFGDRLRVAIEHTGMSQVAFATHIGTTKRSISRYLSGKQLPQGEEMAKLAHALPGQIEWILTGKEPGGIRPRRGRSDIRQELEDFLDEVPDLVLERILWQAKALHTLGKIGKEAFPDYVREVRGDP